MDMNNADRPLSGTTIVSVEHAVAAPFATRQLADLGARVVKIERRDGGDLARGYDSTVNGLSSAFLWLNRGKESMTLDLKAPAGRDVLRRMLDQADVFVHNISPPAATRAKLDAASLLDAHPHLITCTVSGYGTGSRRENDKLYDLLAQAETGLISITGSPGHPARVGVSIADIAAGMYAYSGVLAALLERAKTGQIRPVHVSLFDSLTEWLAYPLYYTMHGGQAPEQMGISHPTIAPYGAFTTKGGQSIVIGVQNDREWKRFCEKVLRDESLARDTRFSTNAQRVRNRGELDSAISAVLLAIDADEAVELMERTGIAYSKLNSLGDLARHPELVERDRWIETGTPVGPIQTLHPACLAGIPPDSSGTVPALGEHTNAILRQFGFSPSDIENLYQTETV
jgi:itaconate CoA-transferase